MDSDSDSRVSQATVQCTPKTAHYINTLTTTDYSQSVWQSVLNGCVPRRCLTFAIAMRRSPCGVRNKMEAKNANQRLGRSIELHAYASRLLLFSFLFFFC
jgi:hypothetical protein